MPPGPSSTARRQTRGPRARAAEGDEPAPDTPLITGDPRAARPQRSLARPPASRAAESRRRARYGTIPSDSRTLRLSTFLPPDSGIRRQGLGSAGCGGSPGRGPCFGTNGPRHRCRFKWGRARPMDDSSGRRRYEHHDDDEADPPSGDSAKSRQCRTAGRRSVEGSDAPQSLPTATSPAPGDRLARPSVR